MDPSPTTDSSDIAAAAAAASSDAVLNLEIQSFFIEKMHSSIPHFIASFFDLNPTNKSVHITHSAHRAAAPQLTNIPPQVFDPSTTLSLKTYLLFFHALPQDIHTILSTNSPIYSNFTASNTTPPSSRSTIIPSILLTKCPLLFVLWFIGVDAFNFYLQLPQHLIYNPAALYNLYIIEHYVFTKSITSPFNQDLHNLIQVAHDLFKDRSTTSIPKSIDHLLPYAIQRVWQIPLIPVHPTRSPSILPLHPITNINILLDSSNSLPSTIEAATLLISTHHYILSLPRDALVFFITPSGLYSTQHLRPPSLLSTDARFNTLHNKEEQQCVPIQSFIDAQLYATTGSHQWIKKQLIVSPNTTFNLPKEIPLYAYNQYLTTINLLSSFLSQLSTTFKLPPKAIPSHSKYTTSLINIDYDYIQKHLFYNDLINSTYPYINNIINQGIHEAITSPLHTITASPGSLFVFSLSKQTTPKPLPASLHRLLDNFLKYVSVHVPELSPTNSSPEALFNRAHVPIHGIIALKSLLFPITTTKKQQPTYLRPNDAFTYLQQIQYPSPTSSLLPKLLQSFINTLTQQDITWTT